VRVTVKPSAYLGLDLLLDGSADCLMTEATPVAPPGQDGAFRRLQRDVPAVLREFFRRTACHPIVHLIVVRQDVADQFPELLPELCTAFDQAKLASYRLLQNERVTDLPLMRSYLDETLELFGDDPWPYGLHGRNQPELERVLRYAQQQGLTERELTVDELFAPAVRDYEFKARMLPGAELGTLESLLGQLPVKEPIES
ncbi:MAG TPA: hypothetical protein VKU60_10680, partial [Chloroflexota bacterium]|nr:hypothetical protein [Chloroflexota bacterium]